MHARDADGSGSWQGANAPDSNAIGQLSNAAMEQRYLCRVLQGLWRNSGRSAASSPCQRGDATPPGPFLAAHPALTPSRVCI